MDIKTIKKIIGIEIEITLNPYALNIDTSSCNRFYQINVD